MHASQTEWYDLESSTTTQQDLATGAKQSRSKQQQQQHISAGETYVQAPS